MNAIKMTNVSKYYGQSRGIADLSLTVDKGEFFGFIGPNGAGKSTTIRTLLGLISSTSGKTEIFGLDISQNRQAILPKIGYLPAETALYPNLKVKQLLKLSADLRKTDCSRQAQLLCERLQLPCDRKLSELSLGNRKKAAIICALQHCPPLLILDEPTGGLDPLMQKEFFDILREQNQQGATVFLSSHVLSEIRRHCTRAAIIRDGRIIACDSVDALTKAGAKRITFSGQIPHDLPEGVRNLKHIDNGVSFLYSGSISPLLRFLSSCPISDLTITEPDPEELFLHYYQNKEGVE